MGTTGLTPCPHLTVPFDWPVWPSAVLEFAWKQREKTVLIPSRAMWVCSLFISITELLLTSKALSVVSEAFPGYVNSILLCYLFLSSPLSSPAPRVGFFLSSSSFFFFSKGITRVTSLFAITVLSTFAA